MMNKAAAVLYKRYLKFCSGKAALLRRCLNLAKPVTTMTQLQPRLNGIIVLLCLLFLSFASIAQDNLTYKIPPKDIADLALAKPTPTVNINSKGEWMLIMERSSYPSVEELAQPELRIAGLRINPRNFGPSRSSYITNIKIKKITTGEEYAISGLPDNLKAASIRWSPDEQQFAFTHTTRDAIHLYVAGINNKTAVQVNKTPLNSVLGSPCQWISNTTILFKATVSDPAAMPSRPAAPNGPIVQENAGKSVASRTYQDLIKSPYDEQLFAFFGSSVFMSVTTSQPGSEKKLGKEGIYADFDVSPDGRYYIQKTIRKPFSYLVPAGGFPQTVNVVSVDNGASEVLAENPSAEGAPIGFDDVVNFPRNHAWRADMPSTIYYVQALDKGLGKSKADWRDAVYTLSFPLEAGSSVTGKELCRTKMRFRNIIWGNASTAILVEGLVATRKMKMNRLNPSAGSVDSLFERRTDDAYSDIGTPIMIKNSFGSNVLLLMDKDSRLLLRSQGASAQGDMPLLQSFDLKTKKTTLLWRCEAPWYETVVEVLDPVKLRILTSRESQTEAPNYFIRDLKAKKLTPLTNFANPYPMLTGVKKEKISYKRKDGIDLTATVYTPKGYDAARDGLLPVLIWAYPREYKSANDAAQVRGSKYTFTRISWGSPVFWVTQGYAVMDNTEMPIVGEGGKEPNDNFVDQLQWNAEAAINKISEMGIGDSTRVAVGGHSYGAFMTANLLAHTRLFKAGIARSGAYNRTLTPFGFQGEERTYWEAPDLYNRMSPFSYAHQIKTPLLLVHGEADNNSGTFPIQSERLFNAVKGHGGIVRLVMLPFESHGYDGKENILHMLWEMNSILDQYVKPAGKKRAF
jgi:dipeptidyl aminopeptidase/acylaminoacyl peptidase